MSSAVKKTVADCPELLKQWDYERNGDLKPEDVTAGNGRKIHWRCPVAEDHRWEARVANRTSNKQGCPCCTGRKAVPSNCLATTHPEIAAQWDYERNGDLSPEDVTAGSNKKVHWKCNVAEDHRWEASSNNRKNNGRGCPCCHGLKVVLSNCLATTHPHLVDQWDYERNGDLSPEDVTAGSNKKVHWKCNVAEDHRWEAQPNSRTNNQGCACCAGKKVVLSNSIIVTHQEIAKQLLPFNLKTGEPQTAEKIMAGSSELYFWDEGCGHGPFEQRVDNRNYLGHGCPECGNIARAKKKVERALQNGSIAITHREIAKQLLPFNLKTGEPQTAEKITFGSNQKYFWDEGCGHGPFEQIVAIRTTQGCGCPVCNRSHGEELIAKLLEEKGITFQKELRLKDCRHIMPLPFDFAIMSEGNIVALIEYQGEQHFKPIERRSKKNKDQERTKKELAETQHRDAIKRTYCQTNNIPLLEVHYEWRETENKVEEELVKFLTSLGL